MILAIILVALGFLVTTSSVSAISPPNRISPTDNSTVSSSKLTWEAPSYSLYSNDPYRVQVDDDSSFPSSSINKDYTTKNTYYTPELTDSTWFWRIKVKDSTGTWSDWSSSWKFTLSSTSSDSSPSPSASISTSSFTISNTPSSIDSAQAFSPKITLSLPDDPSTTFYLKGAFKKDGSSNYFGQTKVGSDFIKNGSSYSNQYKITTDSSGNWSGDLEVQPDILDAGYQGTGSYIFKVGRYTSGGSGPTWSNEVNITINAKEIMAEEDEEVTGISSLHKSPSPKTSTSKKTSDEDLPKEVYALEKYKHTSSDSSVIAAKTESPIKTLGESKTNYLNIILIIGGLVLIIGPVIWYIHHHAKNNI